MTVVKLITSAYFHPVLEIQKVKRIVPSSNRPKGQWNSPPQIMREKRKRKRQDNFTAFPWLNNLYKWHLLPTRLQPPERKLLQRDNRRQTIPGEPNFTESNQAQYDIMHRVRANKLPPIIAHGYNWLNGYYNFKSALNVASQNGATVSYLKYFKTFKFLPGSLEFRERLIRELEKYSVEFYTHDTTAERKPSKKFVAKGVYTLGFPEDKIKKDIIDRYGICPDRCIAMRNAALMIFFRGETALADITKMLQLHSSTAYQARKIQN
ncbi:hypothetical protein EVAR_2650_1 [Eumeta japonica]|uniref:Uncharacterized protein n=1 Tax=Eumeta variegata TaxID=151549 RepID=A0A4C1SPV6_EUMVA|nr:hypothetical protein EVAR_2650_1 [Eumeta japonica]